MSKSFERDLRLAVEDVDRMAGLVADAVRGGV
ncbi:MAG: hypothetical protein JWO38_3777, partial [Gemmataceae bacterium]|nr:hypothetical protein [Gemmataceae bacterium]